MRPALCHRADEPLEKVHLAPFIIKQSLFIQFPDGAVINQTRVFELAYVFIAEAEPMNRCARDQNPERKSGSAALRRSFINRFLIGRC
jgi:hypothetical protein